MIGESYANFNMVSFYFLLLIPLISALRRFDEPDQYNVLQGNKPILRMAANADDSEILRSGSFRSHKKHHHLLRKKKKILDEDSQSSKSTSSSSSSSKSKESSSSSESDSNKPGFFETIMNWISMLQGNFTFVPDDLVLNHTTNKKKHSRQRHTHFKAASQPEEQVGWKEKLWLMFDGMEKHPKHSFARSLLQVYKGYKKDGKLVLRKAFKDIDLSELEDSKLVLPRANKDNDLSELNPEIIYYQ